MSSDTKSVVPKFTELNELAGLLVSSIHLIDNFVELDSDIFFIYTRNKWKK